MIWICIPLSINPGPCLRGGYDIVQPSGIRTWRDFFHYLSMTLYISARSVFLPIQAGHCCLEFSYFEAMSWACLKFFSISCICTHFLAKAVKETWFDQWSFPRNVSCTLWLLNWLNIFIDRFSNSCMFKASAKPVLLKAMMQYICIDFNHDCKTESLTA